MPITVTMLQTRQGEGGVQWTAGNSYSASDEFGAYLITSNLATGTIPLPPKTSLSPAETTATQALVSGAANRVVVADTAFAGASPANADAYLNALFLAASQAFSATLGRVRVVVPAGVWTVQRLFWRQNVEYDFRGAIFEQSLTLGNPLGPMASCVRSNAGATYYNKHRNIKITGGTFKSNGTSGGANVVQMYEFEDAEITDFTVQHATGRNNWAWFFSGRRCKIINPTVLGGTTVLQDALHIGHGREITVLGGYLEAGDDAVVCGYDLTDVSQDMDDEGLDGVSWTGTVVRSAQGFGVSLYYGRDTYGFGGTNRRRLSNIKVTGITGSAGLTRNGGIRIHDNAVGGPGTDNAVIRDCTVDATLNVGSSTHDGNNAFGVHITTGQDNIINAKLVLTDTTGGATRFRPVFVESTNGLTIDVQQTNRVALASRLIPYSATHTIRDVVFQNPKLLAANAVNGSALEIQNGNNGTLTGTQVLGGSIREIPDGGYGVLAQGANSVGTIRLVGTSYRKLAGATTAASYNSATASIVSHIDMLQNDFSDVVGPPGNLFAANHASFFVDANRNFPNKQTGTVTILNGASTATITITGAAVRFSTLTSPAQTQVTVTPTNATARATPVTVALTAATTASITSTAAVGADATYAWTVDTGKKPV